MREIKFRAWDNEKKTFVPQGEIVFKDYGETSWEVIPNCLEYVGDQCHNGEPQRGRFVVTQYTGLKDKNGVEVYEGDILEFKSDPSFYINAKLGDRYIVEYYGAGFFMKPIIWRNRKIEAQNYVGLLPPYQTSNMRNHYEVIGNIHSNPELLK